MNEIPNIEETHDTIEVVVELFELADWRHRMPENTQKAEELLHHQLQKAREEERERVRKEVDVLQERFGDWDNGDENEPLLLKCEVLGLLDNLK